MKSEQRRIIWERLQNLTEKEKRSEVIARKLKKLLENDNCIASFYPLANEPDITSLYDERFAFPKIVERELAFIKANEFKTGKYQIKEPIDGLIISAEAIDAILVPLVGFDDNNNRLGHGGGYYDCFLKSCPRARRIGVGFACQKMDKIIVNENDQRLDMIITEE